MSLPVFTSFDRLPRNIYTAFAVEPRLGLRVVFLPRVLWPHPRRHHLHYFRLEGDLVLNPHVLPSIEQPPSSPQRLPRLLIHAPTTPYIFNFATTFVLPPHDLLYYLHIFFHLPLVDRTATLLPSIPTRILDPIPSFSSSFSISLPDIFNLRARAILIRADAHDVDVRILCTGDLYSTAVLVALLRVAAPHQRERLVIFRAPDLIGEYTTLLSDVVADGVREHVVPSAETEVYVWEIGTPNFLVVTGDLGEQIFGGMYVDLCLRRGRGFASRFFNRGTERWDIIMPTLLENLMIIPKGAGSQWTHLVQMQVAKAPIEITSLFEFLWWMNFSCVWQYVSLRLMMKQSSPTEDLFDRTEHFFRDEMFQQWCYHNHAAKKSRQREWKKYKEPVHEYIFEYSRNAELRKSRTKMRTILYVVDEVGMDESGMCSIGLDEKFKHVMFGRSSICLDRLREKYDCSTNGMLMDGENVGLKVEGNVWEGHTVRMLLRQVRFSWTVQMREKMKLRKMNSEIEMSEAVNQWMFTHGREGMATRKLKKIKAAGLQVGKQKGQKRQDK